MLVYQMAHVYLCLQNIVIFVVLLSLTRLSQMCQIIKWSLTTLMLSKFIFFLIPLRVIYFVLPFLISLALFLVWFTLCCCNFLQLQYFYGIFSWNIKISSQKLNPFFAAFVIAHKTFPCLHHKKSDQIKELKMLNV